MQVACKLEPRWLKLKPASAYSGIGEKKLISLAESGSVRGFQDPDSMRRDWIFDRLSLDAYRDGQAKTEGSAHDKALAIMRSLGR